MDPETAEILIAPKVFETLETFRDWTNSAFQIIMIEIPIIDPDILQLLSNVSSNHHHYPVNGTKEERGDFIGSQVTRDFFIKLIKYAETSSLPSDWNEDNFSASSLSWQIFSRDMVNLVTMLRIETEADYHPETAKIVSQVIRSVGMRWQPSDDERGFWRFCNDESNLICPEHKNRGHRFSQGESLSEINNSEE